MSLALDVPFLPLPVLLILPIFFDVPGLLGVFDQLLFVQTFKHSSSIYSCVEPVFRRSCLIERRLFVQGLAILLLEPQRLGVGGQ